MLRHDFMKNRFYKAETDQLRYFLYLAREGAWVQSGDDLVRFEIKERVEPTQTKKDNVVHYGSQSYPMSAADARYLQVYLSKTVSSASVSSVSSGSNCVVASKHAYLPDLELNVAWADYRELYFSIDISQGICVHAKTQNFDSYYLSKLDAAEDKEPKEKLLLGYVEAKELAQLDSAKNAIWLAAQSGDSQQLEWLFNILPPIDLNSDYKGKSVLEFMLCVNPKEDLPFKNDKPDYKAVINMLLEHGLHKDSLAACHRSYQEQKSFASFFKPSDPLQQELLTLFAATLGLPSNSEEETNLDLHDTCNIM